MKNLLAKVLAPLQGGYRSILSLFLLNILLTVPGFANVKDLITGGSMEARMQTFYYRSTRSNSVTGQVNLIDTAQSMQDGVTNLQNGAIPKDQVFAVGYIAIRFSTGVSAVVSSYFSNAIYGISTIPSQSGSGTGAVINTASAAARIPLALLNGDIEIKCGSDVIFERQSARKFFSERSMNTQNTSDTVLADAVELFEPAYLTGGQPISVTVFTPSGVSFGSTDNVEVAFYGVGTGRK